MKLLGLGFVLLSPRGKRLAGLQKIATEEGTNWDEDQGRGTAQGFREVAAHADGACPMSWCTNYRSQWKYSRNPQAQVLHYQDWARLFEILYNLQQFLVNLRQIIDNM